MKNELQPVDTLDGGIGDDALQGGTGMKCRRWGDGLSTLWVGRNVKVGAGGTATNDEAWRRTA